MTSGLKGLGTMGAVLVLAAVGCAVDSEPEEQAPLSFEEEWNQAYDEHQGGKADTPGCSGVLVPDQYGFDKRLALTFDDGPSAATTPQVLDILAAHGVKGTFFINGSKVRGDTERQILARMQAEGHIVGNHAWEHLNLKNVSATELDRQVRLTRDVIASVGESPMFFRFPFGSAGCTQVDQVEAFGYHVTGWHIDTADWCYASSTGGVGYCSPTTFRYVPDQYRSDMLAYVLSQVRSNNGGVMLFHDVHANTVSHLAEIIEAIQAEGFTFTSLDDVETFPLLNGLTPPFVGDLCSSDDECDFSINSADAECLTYTDGVGQEQGFCTVACNGYCSDRPGEAPTFCVSLDGGQSGSCVSKSAPENESCAAIPGSVARTMDRFIGTSTAAPATAVVCVP